VLAPATSPSDPPPPIGAFVEPQPEANPSKVKMIDEPILYKRLLRIATRQPRFSGNGHFVNWDPTCPSDMGRLRVPMRCPSNALPLSGGRASAADRQSTAC
jgi:hypothetical protein